MSWSVGKVCGFPWVYSDFCTGVSNLLWLQFIAHCIKELLTRSGIGMNILLMVKTILKDFCCHVKSGNNYICNILANLQTIALIV